MTKIEIPTKRYTLISDGGTHNPSVIFDRYAGSLGQGILTSTTIVIKKELEIYIDNLNEDYNHYLKQLSEY